MPRNRQLITIQNIDVQKLHDVPFDLIYMLHVHEKRHTGVTLRQRHVQRAISLVSVKLSLHVEPMLHKHTNKKLYTELMLSMLATA